MPDSEKPSRTPSSRRPEGDKKKYRRPKILYREPLEVMAALCIPAPPVKSNVGMCPSGPISS